MESNHVRDLMEAYSSIYTENEEVEQLDEFSAQAQNFVNDATKTLQSGLKKIGLPINMTQRGTPTKKDQERKINQNQSFDLFDIIKGHLLDEGFADTEEAALAIMTNMSEEWREQILDERRNVTDKPLGIMHRFARGVRTRKGEKTEPIGSDREGNPTGKYLRMKHEKKAAQREKDADEQRRRDSGAMSRGTWDKD